MPGPLCVWCNMMHESPMWPIHRHYKCRACGRIYRVPWTEADERPKQAGKPACFGVLDDQAHAIYLLWWQRIVPYRSYVKGWKIGPSHYVNQDLGTIWLDK